MMLAPAGPAWSVFSLVAFVILKLVLRAGNQWLRSRRACCDKEPALLLLRVFALGHRSEVLFDSVTRCWRHLGHVRLIAGTDLALSTIAPHQFLAFVSGTLEHLFISSESAIENAVAGLDNRRDYDGRFRINDLFCYSDTWQLMVQSLIRTTDVVLMDLRMPRVDGVEATRRIVANLPDTRVIVLTTYADDASVFAALKAGARGYLTKDADAAEIERAIRTVYAGEALLDPSVQRRLLEGLKPSADSHPDGLTEREVEVLRLIAGGLSNQEIAGKLFISEATVKTHINNIFSKADLRDRGQAVAYAFRNGLAEA